MDTRKNLKRYALLSLYNKTDLKDLCTTLLKYKISIISTGTTAKAIKKYGFNCKEVSNITKFPEILDGRVKTLNNKIHGSILFDRKKNNHIKTFKALNFPKIDFVIVNFYPFAKISKIKTKTFEDKCEMIDIGGPALIRSASKNYQYVTSICSKKYYRIFINEIKKNNGYTSLSFRKKMMEINYREVSKYDWSISQWLSKKNNNLSKKNYEIIKYGENKNQKAYFVKNTKKNIFDSKIHGKEIGYNNILDISDGISCIKEFREPTCVIVKHNNPCGVASAKNINLAFKKSYMSDPISAFGGVVLLNKKINKALAIDLNKNFFEIVVAPSFSFEALEILKYKKNLIVIDLSKINIEGGKDFKSVTSGVLYQDINSEKISKSKLKLKTQKSSSTKTLDDLVFALRVAKHVKSNAIVLVNNKQTLGIGAGQMSRIDATKIAIMKYKQFFKNKKFVCASDAFFPFTDNINLLIKNNCIGVVQPRGSINDQQIIDFGNIKKLPIYFTKNRFFKH